MVEGAVDANTIVTLKLGSTAITNGAITLTASGSAAGSVFSATPTAANTVTAGQAIKIESDGNATASVAGRVTLLISV